MVQTRSQKEASRSDDASVLSQLAERCEKATGSDRQLDTAIWLAVNPGSSRRISTVKSSKGLWPDYQLDETRGADGVLTIVPEYSLSLDAAMSLVPDFTNRRWYTADSDADSAGKAVASVYHPADMINTGKIPRSIGATPALALCAAALKARAAQ